MQVTALVVVVFFVLFVPLSATLPSSTVEAPVSALGITAPNTQPDLAGTVSTDHTIDVDGTQRTYRTIAPVQVTHPLPLLVVLHGRGEGLWTAVRTTGFLPLAKRAQAVLLYPTGVDRSWNAGGGCCGTAGKKGLPDTAFVDAAVTAALPALPVDPTRIYLAGYSNGGKLAYSISCTAGKRYAGVATFGSVPLGPCPDGASTPFLLAAGAKDTILPLGGAPKAHPPTLPVRAAADQLAERDRCTGKPVTLPGRTVTVTTWSSCADNARVQLVVYPNDDHMWPEAVSGRMWDFLSGTRLRAAGPGTASAASAGRAAAGSASASPGTVSSVSS